VPAGGRRHSCGIGLAPIHGAAILALLLLAAACTKVGPDFETPKADVAAAWLGADGSHAKAQTPQDAAWWRSFGDPTLDTLVATAYKQNLSLQVAGVRVLQARADLGQAIGNAYPQQQRLVGNALYNRESDNAPNSQIFQTRNLNLPFSLPQRDQSFYSTQFGLTATWEIDFWGKFRRAIESADANLLASIADYDNTLVSLVGDVASGYVTVRTYEERLKIARDNVATQRDSLRIAQARYQAGETGERDVQQALSQLAETEANIPLLEIGLRQAQDALAVLLGMPPAEVRAALGGAGAIPKVPLEVAVGIPADLLRRRPDVLRAEQQAATQSARIGVAKANLYPALSLSGTFAFSSSNTGQSKLSDAFSWGSRQIQVGPAIQWNLFNYGQITNQVRAQDAQYQAAILAYQNTVLQAQREVEDGLVGFAKSQEQAAALTRAVAASRRSLQLAIVEYRQGQTDYTTVLTAEQNLLRQQDQLAVARANVPQGLIGVYRALGGGWQLRQGRDFVPADVKATMAKRTDWGGLLDPDKVAPPTAEERQSLVRWPAW
jgi:NodT family efflux transporter outer membrane factor (OMF) lipoprotein